jgi:hypothetical protein
MSTGQKVALAVLVLLGLCFVVAVVLPSRAGPGTGPPEEAAQVFRGLVVARTSRPTASRATGWSSSGTAR